MPGTHIYVGEKTFVAVYNPANDCEGCAFYRLTSSAETKDCDKASTLHDCYAHSVIFVRDLPEDEQCGVGNG